MSASHITERAMEQALKELMLRHSIKKITVQMITEQCGLTRHTFYNHFSDVYELLGSLFEHEVIQDLEIYCNSQQWRKSIMLVLDYTLENKVVCLNTFKSLGREHLESFLYRIFRSVLDGIIESIDVEKKVRKAYKEEVSDFFTYAIVGQFLAWLNTGMKEEPETIEARIARLLEGTISRLILEEK